jgi:alginate O-acetyltransferase complex protein AlgJ
MKKTKFYPKIFIALFSILLLFLGLYTTKSLETFVDSFGLRDNLISWSMNFKFLVLKDNYYNMMYTTDQHWLNYIGENSLDDAQNTYPFTSEQLETIHAKLSNIQQTLNERGIKFYLVIPPNKNTIYPDDLDWIAPKRQEISRLDQLVQYEQFHSGLNIIDVRSELFEAKENNPVFYPTDTHWNDYGSWVAYFNIISAISQDFPKIVPNPLGKFDVGYKNFSGDLAKMSGKLKIDEITQILTLQNPKKVSYDNTVLYKDFISYIDDPELPVALVFKDSFYSLLQANMGQHFRESVCLSTFKFDYGKVDEVQPDLVIYEVTERYLHQLLYLP